MSSEMSGGSGRSEKEMFVVGLVLVTLLFIAIL